MATRNAYPTYARVHAEQVLIAWQHLDHGAFGQINRDELAARIQAYDDIIDRIADLRDELAAAVSKKKDLGSYMWDGVKLARAGAMTFYGEDSVEYHRFGRVRSSDRRPASRNKDKPSTTDK